MKNSGLTQAFKINRNMKPLTKEIGGYWGMVGASEHYFSAFAVALKSSELQIALLNAVPQIFGGLAQVFGLRLITSGLSRLKIVLVGCYIQILSLLFLGLVPFLTESTNLRAWGVLLLVVSYFASLNAHVPAWFSLYRDLIPENIRAKFSGYRSQCGLIILFIVYSISGVILDFADKQGQIYVGFLVIFLIACCFRSFSTYQNSRLENPEFIQTAESRFSFKQFLRRMPRSRFGHFVIFSSLMNMSIILGGAFIPMYLLRGLEFDYLTYMLITSAASICQFGTALRWGHMIDQYGNLKILHVTAALLCLVPIALLISTNPIWIVLIFILIGVASAGYNLACFNYLFVTVTSDKVPRCSAYHNIILGTLHLIGALVGAGILHLCQTLRIETLLPAELAPYAIVFITSAILRILSTLLFWKISEPHRTVRQSSGAEILNQAH
jgi:hypothetical protein